MPRHIFPAASPSIPPTSYAPRVESWNQCPIVGSPPQLGRYVSDFLQARFCPTVKEDQLVYFDDFLPLLEPARGSIPRLALDLPENLVRPLDNRIGNPGWLGHMDAVALCGPPTVEGIEVIKIFFTRLTILKHMDDVVRSEGHVIGSRSLP